MLQYDLQFFLPHPSRAADAHVNSVQGALESVLRTLEVFVLTKDEVASKLQAVKTSECLWA
jgi:hypothetical protein